MIALPWVAVRGEEAIPFVAMSALKPAGEYAARLVDLWWLFFWICAASYAIVIIYLGIAVRRGAKRAEPDDSEEGGRSSARVATLYIGSTIVLLFILLVASVATGRSISPLGASATREIKITGHQWWWDVQYPDPIPSNIIYDANEIHIPAGERVLLQLTSADVIHSLWFPNVQGKRDLIPGKEATLLIQADKPGVYRGQCYEFCGFQHAKMGILLIVHTREGWNVWAEAQRKTSRAPQSLDEQRGQQIFMTTSCALCHRIAGTDAGSRVGPDLTHVGSRRTLGAAAIPNTRGNLAGWIVNPQHIKPGVLMPPNNYEPDDLHALVAYLESLK